jgi:hypothetical protein
LLIDSATAVAACHGTTGIRLARRAHQITKTCLLVMAVLLRRRKLLLQLLACHRQLLLQRRGCDSGVLL